MENSRLASFNLKSIYKRKVCNINCSKELLVQLANEISIFGIIFINKTIQIN